MRNLLSANFMRLRKSGVFWLGMAFMFGMGIVASFTRYREMHDVSDYFPNCEEILFAGSPFMAIAAAAFVGLFLGTEYSDGTIRNKLTAGHSRTVVYLSSLIVSYIATALLHLAFLLAVVVVGFPLVGNLGTPVPALLALTGVSLLTVLALSSIFVTLAMLVTKKAVACVSALLLGFAMMMAAMTINFRLSEPEFHPSYTAYTSSDADSGSVQLQEANMTPNPRYLQGTQRAVYAFLNDFLPVNQLLQISEQSLTSPVLLPVYSLVIFAGCTVCGIAVFRRKDLK